MSSKNNIDILINATDNASGVLKKTDVVGVNWDTHYSVFIQYRDTYV